MLASNLALGMPDDPCCPLIREGGYARWFTHELGCVFMADQSDVDLRSAIIT